MSSFIKSLSKREFVKFFKYASVVFPQRSFLSELNFSPVSGGSSFSRIRFYATQRSIEQEDVSKNSQIQSSNLKAEFYHLDSLLKRNILIGENSVKKLITQVKHSAANGDHITSQQVLFLLQCCGTSISREDAQINIEVVMDIWNMCQEQGLPLDISHYNALLKIFLENEHKFSPNDFLSTLEEKNLQPNHITYSRLIARFCQEGNIEEAMKILELMKDKNLPLTEYIFNSLILGNSRCKNLEGARNVLEMMKNSNCLSTANTYAALLEAYAENGDWESMKQLLVQCEKDEMIFAYRSLMSLICTLANNPPEDASLMEMILANIRKIDCDKSSLESSLLRLMGAGNDETAYELLRTFNPMGRSYQLSGLPKNVASSSEDLSRVVKLCGEMTREGVNVLAFEHAFESYLLEKKFDHASNLLQEMKARDIPLKEHYFYPLVCHFGETYGRQKVFELFEEMVRLNVPLSEDFFSMFLMPNVSSSDDIGDLENIYSRLLSQREVNVDKVFNGVVVYLLKKRNVKAAAEFVKRFPRGLRMSLGRLLAVAHLDVGDAESTVSILRQLLSVSIRQRRETPKADDDHDGVRHFLFPFIRGLKKTDHFEANLASFFTEMEIKGVGFPSSLVGPLVSYIGDHMTNRIHRMLSRLSHPSLVLAEQDPYFRQGDNVDELRRKLEAAEQSREPNSELKINLLCGLIREKRVEEVKELRSELKKELVTVPPAVLVCLLDLWLDENQLSEAEVVFNELLNDYSEFQMHAHKVLKYASFLVMDGRVEDAATSLQKASPEGGEWTLETSPQPQISSYRQRFSPMLSFIVEKKDVVSLQLIQDILLSRKFGPPSLILPPLLKYYLEEDNVEEAFSLYVKVAEEHRMTIGDVELLKASIHNENKDMLQQIVEINNKIHGEMNSWFTLAFALLEMGKLRQAEKIFRTPGIRALHKRLNGYCQHLVATGQIDQVELVIKATKELFGADRPRLYEFLLEGMISLDDPERALAVWMNMQEENAIPTSQFLITLASFLRSKDLEVPFVVPDASSTLEATRPSPRTSRDSRRVFESTAIDTLARALNEQDLSMIHSAWNRLKESDESVPFALSNRVIGSLLKFDQTDEAIAITKSLLVTNQLPSRNTMRLLLQKLALQSDVATIEFLEKYIDQAQKRNYSYNYYRGLTYIGAGRTEEYLHTILQTIESSDQTSEDVPITPRIVENIVTNHYEHYPLLERCAQSLQEKGDFSLYSSLWDVTFAHGKLEKAEEIYEKYLKDENEIATHSVLSVSRSDEDTKKLDDLLKVVNRKEGRETMKGLIFSTYIDILNNKGKFEEASKVLEDSLKSIKLEHYRPKALGFMEKQFRDNGLTFPYNLSILREEKSNSSFSSDD